jgi:hypothetical protein
MDKSCAHRQSGQLLHPATATFDGGLAAMIPTAIPIAIPTAFMFTSSEQVTPSRVPLGSRHHHIAGT